jgi:hypothetical protein
MLRLKKSVSGGNPILQNTVTLRKTGEGAQPAHVGDFV